MDKKGSMELSVNSIVILVIAIVMLGLILGFVRSKFSALDKQLVNNEPDAQAATPNERLTISRETIAVSGGEDIVLKMQVYAIRAITSDMSPSISCNDGLVIDTKVQSKEVAQGESGKYTMTAKIPGSASKGTYLCSLKMDWPPIPEDATVNPVIPAQSAVDLSKDVVIEVR